MFRTEFVTQHLIPRPPCGWSGNFLPTAEWAQLAVITIRQFDFPTFGRGVGKLGQCRFFLLWTVLMFPEDETTLAADLDEVSDILATMILSNEMAEVP